MTAAKKRNLYIVLLIAYLILVGWLCFGEFSSDTQVSQDLFGVPMDKIIHFLMFLPFPVIMTGVFKGKTKKPIHSLLMVMAFFFAGCIIAAGTEIGQGLTSYRVADPADFFADGLGLVTGSVLALVIDLKNSLRYD